MAFRTRSIAAMLVALPLAAAAENYVGVLKAPKDDTQLPAGFFSLASEPVQSFAPATRPGDAGYRLKLGYQYSRYLSVEGQFVDFGRAPGDIFASPGNLASAFRSQGQGMGVDTVATLPWRSFSFYGRLGAYRGDSHNAFAAYSTSLLGDSSRGTRWRYGLGVRYDFTKALGIKAEVERYSPLGTPLDAQVETDLISVGLSWRF